MILQAIFLLEPLSLRLSPMVFPMYPEKRQILTFRGGGIQNLVQNTETSYSYHPTVGSLEVVLPARTLDYDGFLFSPSIRLPRARPTRPPCLSPWHTWDLASSIPFLAVRQPSSRPQYSCRLLPSHPTEIDAMGGRGPCLAMSIRTSF